MIMDFPSAIGYPAGGVRVVHSLQGAGAVRARLTWRRLVVFLAIQAVVIFLLSEVLLRLLVPHDGTLRQLVIEQASAARLARVDTLEELMETTMIGFRPMSEGYGFILNSRSLRTKEYTEVKPPGVHRILAFGDSFTYASGGLPHRHHWPTILERVLTRHNRIGPVEVLRLGVPATGPLFQLRLWQLEGSRLNADTVVVAFFVGNDFLDHTVVPVGGGLRKTSLRGWIAHNSYVVRVVLNLGNVLRNVENGGRPTFSSGRHGGQDGQERGGYEVPGYRRPGHGRNAKLTIEKFYDIEERRMALCLRSNLARFEQALDGVLPILLRFRNDVEATGARFVVMIIPDEYQVSPGVSAEILSRVGRSLADYDLEIPQRRLGECLRKEGVEVLDLLPAFRQRGQQVDLYNTRDTHWNREGNQLAANALVDFLESDR